MALRKRLNGERNLTGEVNHERDMRRMRPGSNRPLNENTLAFPKFRSATEVICIVDGKQIMGLISGCDDEGRKGSFVYNISDEDQIVIATAIPEKSLVHATPASKLKDYVRHYPTQKTGFVSKVFLEFQDDELNWVVNITDEKEGGEVIAENVRKNKLGLIDRRHGLSRRSSRGETEDDWDRMQFHREQEQ